MAKLLIIGAGGHGKVVADTAIEMEQWDEIAYLDDRYPDISSTLCFSVIGKIGEIDLFQYKFPDVVVAIGNNELRVRLLQRIHESGFRIPAIVSPNSYISRYAEIGQGTVVFAQVAINVSVAIGDGCIINTGATIDHDCKLGTGVHISPGAHLAGGVRVGDYSWIATGANVIPGVTIGKNVVIGAGAVVINDVPDAVMVAGNPGKIKKHL